MQQTTIVTLVLIALAAVLAPLVSELTRGLRIPPIVVEIAFGIVLGRYVLNLAHPSVVVNYLSDMGLTYLMFLVGFELDLGRIRGRPLALATASWLISLALALAFAFALVSTGLALDTVIIGMALTTTTLGTLMPVLGDAGVIATRFGAYTMALATAGEFGPIVLIGILLTKKDPRISGALLFAFLVVATVSAILASRAHPPALVALLRRHLQSSGQLPVRLSLLLVLLLVYLALTFGLDLLLGAFAAGVLVRLLISSDDREVVGSKLGAIGFGFLVPIFFVVSGIHFDLHILLSRPSTLLRLVFFLVLLLAIRAVPAFLVYRHSLPPAERLPLALFSATGLPLIVVITTIGVTEGRIRPENAAALVGAGMLSVFVFPVIGLWRLRVVARAAAGGGAPEPAAPQGPGSG